ncbi:DUF2892 domain-containing protein [Natroniella sulfidigena]|uniref:YgaP family membrane protein n=1 Tax=Natroniella sulfidigena TaxID=723921 RepID=UPI002009E219|nr:DUF2892 domain-containing protein [Natroniella sulfidigena]MCK8816922.1 DUF2892 domain-containing protein [Natroniella sulfidigena]
MELDFEKNLGEMDRIIRLIIGFLLIFSVYYWNLVGWLAVVIVIVAISQFIEAAFSY